MKPVKKNRRFLSLSAFFFDGTLFALNYAVKIPADFGKEV